jgi:hypothetical protein
MADRVVRAGVGVAVLAFKDQRRARETARRIEDELKRAIAEGVDIEDGDAMRPRLRRAALYRED